MGSRVPRLLESSPTVQETNPSAPSMPLMLEMAAHCFEIRRCRQILLELDLCGAGFQRFKAREMTGVLLIPLFDPPETVCCPKEKTRRLRILPVKERF